LNKRKDEESDECSQDKWDAEEDEEKRDSVKNDYFLGGNSEEDGSREGTSSDEVSNASYDDENDEPLQPFRKRIKRGRHGQQKKRKKYAGNSDDEGKKTQLFIP